MNRNEMFCKYLIRMAECCLKWHRATAMDDVFFLDMNSLPFNSGDIAPECVYLELKDNWENIEKMFIVNDEIPECPSAKDQIKWIPPLNKKQKNIIE